MPKPRHHDAESASVKPPRAERGVWDDVSVSGIAKTAGVVTGLGFGLWWLSRIHQSNENERAAWREEKLRNNEAWDQRERSATQRGRGRFANLGEDRAPEAKESAARGQRAASSASPPAAKAGVPDTAYGEFDARMRVSEAASEAELWTKYPEEMAQQARERAAATGEPLDPRAQRGLVKRGSFDWSRPAPAANPNPVEAGPGVDVENMKRAKPGPIEAPGFRGGSRAGAWAGRAGAAAGWLAVGFELWDFGRDWKELGLKGAWKKRHPDDYQRGDLFRGNPAVDSVVDEFIRQNTRQPAAKPAAPAAGGPSEEEARAAYSDGEQDERAPSNVGGVPVDYVPTINPNAGQYVNAGGWGESAPRAKRGKPFADPYHIGQARLQAEHDMEEQNEAERRTARQREQDERKAEKYIRHIETEDRKRERARAASEKRQIAAENSLFWGLQLDAWERERLEHGDRRRRRSINVNEWQAAGAVVGGFSQINVELVRGEVERALERGDTAIRMN